MSWLLYFVVYFDTQGFTNIFPLKNAKMTCTLLYMSCRIEAQKRLQIYRYTSHSSIGKLSFTDKSQVTF